MIYYNTVVHRVFYMMSRTTSHDKGVKKILLALLMSCIIPLLFSGALWAFYVLPRRREMRRINQDLARYRVGGQYAYEADGFRCTFRVMAMEPGIVSWCGKVTQVPRLMARIDQAKHAVCISFFEAGENGVLRGGCDYDPECEGGTLMEIDADD